MYVRKLNCAVVKSVRIGFVAVPKRRAVDFMPTWISSVLSWSKYNEEELGKRGEVEVLDEHR